jgi:Tol biopolymer transport system component
VTCRTKMRWLLLGTVLVMVGCGRPLVVPTPVADSDSGSCPGTHPAVGAGVGWGASPTEIAPNGPIVAERVDVRGDDLASIVRVDPLAGTEQRLIELAAMQEPFAVSPDGRWLAFVDGGVSSSVWGTELKVARSDGTSVRALFSATEYVRGLAWSPDSKSVAFLADDHLDRVNLEDASLTRVAAAPTNSYSQGFRQMRWSPDGRWLAFHGPDYQTINLVRGDGSEAPLFFAQGHGFDWSPDGSELAFTHFSGLSVAHPDGTAVRHLIAADPGNPIQEPRWSPDGDAIAVLVGEFSPGGLCIARIDGSVSQVATGVDLDGLDGPEWSPDGTRLAIRTVESDPDGPILRLATLAESGDDLRPISDFLLYPHWMAAP